MRSTYAGVDWASEKHDVLIGDETGEEILAATFVHDEAGGAGLVSRPCASLVRLVAIELPDGLLVERLLVTWAADLAAASLPGRGYL